MASPALVNGPQYFSTGTTGTSLACPPATTPAATHKLYIGLTISAAASGISITDNGSTPSGWSLVGSVVLSTVQLYVWSKVSSGDESNILVSWTGSALSSAEYQEWSTAGANETIATGSTASAASPVAFGPVAAPSDPNAVPIVFLGFRKGGTINTWSVSSGWSLGVGGSVNDSCLVAYQTTPPNAAVSGTVSYTGSGPTGSAVAWLGFFLDPPGSASNSATIGGTLGALAAGAAVSATLAASIAAGIGPNAEAATIGAANAASVAAAVGALASVAAGSAWQSIASSSELSLASALSLAQLQALVVAADFGSLSSSLVVEAVGGINTAAIDSSLGALLSSVTVTAHAGVNTASIAATLGALSTAGTASAQASMAGAGSLVLQPGVALTAHGTAALASLIGPLASSLTVQPGAATLPVDDRYYIAAPYRPFYAALSARSFYVMSNPNITQRFDVKDPRETVVLTFDATADLDEGETLTGTPEVEIANAYGVDPDAANVVSGAQINAAAITANGVQIAAGHAVQAIASAGLNQCGYLVAITCATSNPEKVLTLKGILPVSSS